MFTATDAPNRRLTVDCITNQLGNIAVFGYTEAFSSVVLLRIKTQSTLAIIMLFRVGF